MQNEATSLSALNVADVRRSRVGAGVLRSRYVSGLLALLAAVPIAYGIGLINSALPGQPEKAVKLVGVAFAGLLFCAPATYLVIRRRAATLQGLAFVVVASVLVLLVAVYLYSVSAEIVFPADILIWSESDFVNDIIKFRQGFPIFTAQVNNESFTYVPGTQLLTYFIARLSGYPLSIAAYRVIQVGYTLLAALVAVRCCRQLLEVSESESQNNFAWGTISLPLLFLVATNTLTNPFTHLLHNDALTQLVTLVAYSILLAYAATGNKRLLWLMAIIPSLGFWVKQSVLIWAFFYCLHLALFDKKRSIKRLCLFAIATFGGLMLSIGVGYAIWGRDLIYWVFTVLGEHGVSPLRSFQHVLAIWPYYAIGILGGLVLLRTSRYKELMGPWVIWLCLISLEAYTSGVAWMLNHIGPGCLIAGVWFLAALIHLAPKFAYLSSPLFDGRRAVVAAGSVATFCLLLSGLGVVRVPLQSFADDANRYVAAIENEFQGQRADEVLLDFGSWIYVQNKVVMKDRAASIGERGYSETGDFSGIIQRLREKRYAKILVRNFHSNDFWYDHDSWPKPSGIREVMAENYREVGTIPPAAMQIPNARPYGLCEISILVPRN